MTAESGKGNPAPKNVRAVIHAGLARENGRLESFNPVTDNQEIAVPDADSTLSKTLHFCQTAGKPGFLI
jgi:hypothetical protein